jgi:hypothetical protein
VLVVEFDPTQFNFIVAEEQRYFLLSLGDGRPLLVPDACPHRGGPLHLGRLDDCGEAITCPWHETAIPMRHLARKAIPMIWRRSTAIAVLPAAEGSQVFLMKRRVLATLRGV